MIPNRAWFPTNLAERAAWYLNFNMQAQASGATLGLTAADLTQISDDNDVMQFLAGVATQVKAYDDAVRQYRTIITEGNIGEMTPPFPADPALALPVVIPTGLFERLNAYRTRILASAAYTDEQGALYGIVGSAPVPPPPASVKPTIEVFAAQTGYVYSVVVGNRAESNMWEVWILPTGAAAWTLVKTANGKSVDITAAPTTPGEPMQMQVRIQLKKNNQNYGQLSDTVYTTVNP